MNPFKYTVSLRIGHPNITAMEIVNRLGITPKHMWTVGEPRKTPRGDPLPGNYKETYCYFLVGSGEGKELAKLLDSCCDRLYQHADFFQSIRSTGGKLEYFIGWFADNNCGETFDIGLLRKLVDLGIDISIDLYPCNWEERWTNKLDQATDPAGSLD